MMDRSMPPAARGGAAAALVAAVVSIATAHAQVTRGDAVTVTATRTEAAPFDVPASIDVVDGDQVRSGRLQVNLSESLGVVPGLELQNRQNYAQDLQLSIRGFGARSTFGIRGVRVYVDGIPATLPDGQGQLTNIDLGSVDRIEVLRGPFSALYGNSSGGVLQTFTEDGHGPLTITPSYALGSNATLRAGLKATGSLGGETTQDEVDYTISGSHFETDGSRDHSAAQRDIGNAKLVFRPGGGTTVTVVFNTIDLPMAQDPLGLTRAEYTQNPRGVDPSAIQFNTRKTFDQTQAGMIVDQRLDNGDSLRAMVYGGERRTQQFQAIPVATETPVTSPGGVIHLDRDYFGTDLRFTHRTRVLDGPLDIVGGLAGDQLHEHRQGYQNFIGSGSSLLLGVQGALRRDEENRVHDVDEYLQASWRFAPAWTLDAGVRHSNVDFTSDDHYVVVTPTGVNPDDSGGVRYRATLPVAGVMFAALPSVHFYATAGRGFETPTLNELAYRPNGQTGLNLALKPAHSTSLETGVKTRFVLSDRSDLHANAAIYSTGTHDEIVTLSNVGGRSTYTNAGRTRRRGVETSVDWRFADDWHLAAAYTFIDARYRDPFATCNAAPCTVPTIQVPAGDRIPGIAASNAYAELVYSPEQGFRAGLEGRHASKVWVDDANSDAAAGYAVMNARVGYRWLSGPWRLEGFARLDNVTNRHYAGSVIVNEGNGRYFEPAQGRVWLAGANVSVALDSR